MRRGPGGGGAARGRFLAQYAPGDYEVLLLDTDIERARQIADEAGRRARGAGLNVLTAVAAFPSDGRTADALIGRASALLRGPDGEAESGRGPVLTSESMRKLYRLAERAAAGRSANGLINVLILGETGVGKEVLAEMHAPAFAARGRARSSALNCAALTETLLESELFGHERGAFTGAVQAKPGLLETARRRARVFLDEVGELPLTLQAKLLRVLETRAGDARRRRSSRGRSTCASSPRPTAISRPRCGEARSARICSSASTASR